MTSTALVTGASTGIGEAIALDLARRGWRVFATVRKQQDADRLNSNGLANLHVVFMDVTDKESIARAYEEVSAQLGDDGLDALINNAGIAVFGPLAYLPEERIRQQLDVNLFGQLTVTRTFLPLLARVKGRIVFMSSLAGRTVSPFFGIYSASKHALEAAAQALRVELRPMGIKVIIVEPGSVKTPIWDKNGAGSEDAFNDLPQEALDIYKPSLRRASRIMRNLAESGIPAQKVADVVYRALTTRRPRDRYLIGRDAHMLVMVWRLPFRIRDRIMARMFKLS